MNLNTCNFIKRIEQVLAELDISAIEEYVIIILLLLIVKGMSVVVNVMLSLMSVMSTPPALCNLSVRTAVKLCIFCVLAFGVSSVS